MSRFSPLILIQLSLILLCGLSLFTPLVSWSFLNYSYNTITTWETYALLGTLPFMTWSVLRRQKLFTIVIWLGQALIHGHLFFVWNIEIPQWLLWLEQYSQDLVTIRYGAFLMPLSWLLLPVLPLFNLSFFGGLKPRPEKSGRSDWGADQRVSSSTH